MSGERQGDREAMDRMVKRIMTSNVPPKDAEQQARDSMKRVDQKLRDEGRR